MTVNHKLKKFVDKEAAKSGLFADWDYGGKHPVLHLSRGGISRSTTVAGSPRSGDNQRNWLRQDIRRINLEIR